MSAESASRQEQAHKSSSQLSDVINNPLVAGLFLGGTGFLIVNTLIATPEDLAYWDVTRRSWRIEPGRFEIQVGHSSSDIRLRQSFELT